MAGTDGTLWLKINFKQVHCVDYVHQFKSDNSGNVLRSWRCTENNCVCHDGGECGQISATVSIEREDFDMSSFSDCKYGDTLKFSSLNGFELYEVSVTEKLSN